MPKICLVCGATNLKPPLTQFVEEKQYQGALKTKEDYQKNLVATVYYCSWECLNLQLDKREKEDFDKGKCLNCGEYLVVLNDQCPDQKHQLEAHYLRVKTPAV